MFSAEANPSTPMVGPLVGGALAGLLGALACFATAHATGTELVVDARGGPASVPVGAVVLASLLGAAAGGALAWLAHRCTRPRRVFLMWTGAGLLLSFYPPLQAAVGWATAAWLVGMHVVVAAGLVPAVAVGLPVGPDSTRAADPAAVAGRTGR